MIFEPTLDDYNKYISFLEIMSKLSRLFSESDIPFINYRFVENLFCRCFNAENLSRSDTAFDAKINTLGIGIKTFTIPNKSSYEKIAEFNKLSSHLKLLKPHELAHSLSVFRNERISLAKRIYGISESIYHIVARQKSKIILFETDYSQIDLNNVSDINSTDKSLFFHDNINCYKYSYSKSTLYRKFILPDNTISIDINILKDPFELLSELSNIINQRDLIPATEASSFVILPLYGRGRKVYEKSGLNQWNAKGRIRNIGELYIPIPSIIHKYFPDFFPSKNETFDLKIPTGEIFSAKICQDNGKALMTNPNKQLSDWLLRNILQLREKELATIEKLDLLGFDSVIINKIDHNKFTIDIMKTGSYEDFIASQVDKSL